MRCIIRPARDDAPVMVSHLDRARLLSDLGQDLALARPRHLAGCRGAVLPGAHLDLSQETAREIVPELGPGLTLRGLWLNNCDLGPDDAPALATLLAHHPALAHLALADNHLGPRGVAALLPALAAHPGLRSLDLGDNDLDSDTVCLIGHALKDTRIVHLRLGGPRNRLTSPQVFAELLRREPAWYGLTLPATDPTAILAALFHNTRLGRLDLGQPLPPDALAHLCASANRTRSRPPPDLARLRRSLPPRPLPSTPLPLTAAPIAADLDAALRVLEHLSSRPDLQAHAHPRLAELRAAILRLQRGQRRDDRRAARKRRSTRRREQRQAEDRRRIDEAQIRQRELGVAVTVTAPENPILHELHTARPCYVCKTPYTQLHFFYDRLCPTCAALNFTRRTETIDLRGRVALVTGGRIKIGHHVALRLLAWGARVIVTSRFARDAARRFAAHPEFVSFRDRLHIYSLDLRAIPRVEAFAAHVDAAYPALDILINNAAQTIQRPPEYYAALLADEAAPAALPPALESILPEGHVPSTIAIPEHPLFPQRSDDGFGQPLDLRERNSWRLRLDEVGTVELLEVQLINAVAPFVLNARLRRAMARAGRPTFIVNVSAPEGRFDRDYKAPYHPHTNMAKAALNMMTRTSADDYARDAIYMTSVDTGWASNENPQPIAEAMKERGFMPPLDLVDAAARVCDPVARGLRDGELLRGIFLKDYAPITW